MFFGVRNLLSDPFNNQIIPYSNQLRLRFLAIQIKAVHTFKSARNPFELIQFSMSLPEAGKNRELLNKTR